MSKETTRKMGVVASEMMMIVSSLMLTSSYVSVSGQLCDPDTGPNQLYDKYGITECHSTKCCVSNVYLEACPTTCCDVTCNEDTTSMPLSSASPTSPPTESTTPLRSIFSNLVTLYPHVTISAPRPINITKLQPNGCDFPLTPVTCIINPCLLSKCPRYPSAVCKVNNCGKCTATWTLNRVDEKGVPVTVSPQQCTTWRPTISPTQSPTSQITSPLPTPLTTVSASPSTSSTDATNHTSTITFIVDSDPSSETITAESTTKSKKWDNAANWNLKRIPVPGDMVLFPTPTNDFTVTKVMVGTSATSLGVRYQAKTPLHLCFFEEGARLRFQNGVVPTDEPSSEPSTPVEVIIGAIVGGIVALILLICAIIFWRSERRQKKSVGKTTLEFADVEVQSNHFIITERTATNGADIVSNPAIESPQPHAGDENTQGQHSSKPKDEVQTKDGNHVTVVRVEPQPKSNDDDLSQSE